MKKAGEFDYNGVNEKTKIPLGIFYSVEKSTFEEEISSRRGLDPVGDSAESGLASKLI